MIDLKNKIEKARKLVSANKVKDAIDIFTELATGSNDNDLRDAAIMLSAQYAFFDTNVALNTDNDIQLRNKTIRSILDFLTQLENLLEKKALSNRNTITPISKADIWFQSLLYRLNHAKDVKVYLRHFGHPDDAFESRKAEIIKIMRQFARLIYESSETVRIVGYLSAAEQTKNPKTWLINEIASYTSVTYAKAQMLVNQCVTVLDRQPINNTNSVYVFDNSQLLYSYRRKDETWEFYEIELHDSIIPYFITMGFQKIIEK